MTCFYFDISLDGTADPHCSTCSCPRGHYCPRAVTSPTPCPGGKYTEEEGATGLEFCKSCPVGHYCTSGTDTPTQCQPGEQLIIIIIIIGGLTRSGITVHQGLIHQHSASLVRNLLLLLLLAGWSGWSLLYIRDWYTDTVTTWWVTYYYYYY